MTDNATVQIPNDVLTPIIEAKITEALSGALGNNAQLLRLAVEKVLTQKVDTDGKPSRGYGNDVAFIDYITSNALREAVKVAVQEALTAQKEIVRAALLRELQRKNSPFVKQLVTGMIEGTFDASRIKYGVTVNVTPKEDYR